MVEFLQGLLVFRRSDAERRTVRQKRRTAADRNLTPGRRAWAAAIAIALLAPTPSGHARGLSVGMRVRQEFDQPLVPVSRSIRTCFKPDADGRPALAVCPEEPVRAVSLPPPQRAPAVAPSPPAPGKLLRQDR